MGIRAQTARVRLRWPTQQQVPIGGGYYVYASAADGDTVNYDTPLNAAMIPAWQGDHVGHKAGFGMAATGSGFGDDSFGADADPAGFGQAAFGLDDFGRGDHWHEFTTSPLTDGTYKFAVCPVDAAGNINTSDALEISVTVAGTPYPPSAAEITAYDDATDTLTVEWTPDPRNASD